MKPVSATGVAMWVRVLVLAVAVAGCRSHTGAARAPVSESAVPSISATVSPSPGVHATPDGRTSNAAPTASPRAIPSPLTTSTDPKDGTAVTTTISPDARSGSKTIVHVHVRSKWPATNYLLEWGAGPADSGTSPYSFSCESAPKRESYEYDTTFTHIYRIHAHYQLHVDMEHINCGEKGATGVTFIGRYAKDLVITEGTENSNGPTMPTANPDRWDSKYGTQYEVNLYDPDGWVRWATIDWGDGSPPELVDRPLSDCHDPKTYWPRTSEQVTHEYLTPGPHRVTTKVTSTGCDGKDEQSASGAGVLQ